MKCSNVECGKEFQAKTHNQKYCSDECCRVATNRRIMEKYYEKKAIKNGALRMCKKCKAPLSRYNMSDRCASCDRNKHLSHKQQIMEIINDIG